MAAAAHSKRVEKELSLLSLLPQNYYKKTVRTSPKSTNINIEISIECFPELRTTSTIPSINLEILLDEQYPFYAPVVLCKSKFMYPSIADGRDLTYDLIGNREWSPVTTLSDMVTRTPVLVAEALKDPVCGTFHLGHYYDLSLWDEFPECFKINCQEKYPLDNSISVKRCIILTDNIYLLLEPKKDEPKQALLVAWGFLNSLLRVKTISEDSVLLSWRPKGDSGESWEQTLSIEGDVDIFIDELVGRMRRLKTVQVKSADETGGPQQKKVLLGEDEVSLKAISGLDINEINENIAIYESSLESEPSISAFQTLMLLYQKAIEYYSAIEDPVHELYVKKLQGLIQTKQVQFLLSSPEKKEESKSEKMLLTEEEMKEPSKIEAEKELQHKEHKEEEIKVEIIKPENKEVVEEKEERKDESESKTLEQDKEVNKKEESENTDTKEESKNNSEEKKEKEKIIGKEEEKDEKEESKNNSEEKKEKEKIIGKEEEENANKKGKEEEVFKISDD